MAKLVRSHDGMSRFYLPRVPSPSSEGDASGRLRRVFVGLAMLLMWGLLPVLFLSRSYIFPPQLAAVTSVGAEAQQEDAVEPPREFIGGQAPLGQTGGSSSASPLPAPQPEEFPAAGLSTPWTVGDLPLPSYQHAPPQPGEHSFEGFRLGLRQPGMASGWPGQQRSAPFYTGAPRSMDSRFRHASPFPAHLRDIPVWAAREAPAQAGTAPEPAAPASPDATLPPVAPVPATPVPLGSDLKARCGELAILPPPTVLQGQKPPPLPKSLLPRRSPDERRLLIVSTGGVGTSTLISELMPALEGHGIGIVLNDVNDSDGLKHAWLSECTLQRVRRFGPTAILYVLGEPAAATYSHFRRGWAGAQACKLAKDAEASLLAPGLGAALLLNAKPQSIFRTSAASSWADYVRWVDSQGPLWRDPMGFVEHARSWQLGAAELGAPIWFSSLADLVADAYPIPILLGFPSNATANRSRPLFSLSLRKPSYSPARLPKTFLEAYAGVSAELSTLRGLCYEPMPAGGASGSRCAAAGLPTTLLDPPTQSMFEGLGTGAAGGDPTYRFFAHTQVREGSECWKLMKPRTALRPTRLPF